MQTMFKCLVVASSVEKRLNQDIIKVVLSQEDGADRKVEENLKLNMLCQGGRSKHHI